MVFQVLIVGIDVLVQISMNYLQQITDKNNGAGKEIENFDDEV
jgi:hypothetical protein